jgi:hypothetical protein
MKTYKFKIQVYLLVLYVLLFITSCKKAIEVSSPPNVLTTDKVFDSNASAIAATLSDYTSVSLFDANFIQYADQYVDELTAPTLNATSTDFANGSITITNGAVASEWQNLYVTIYKANANIQQLQNAIALTDSVKKQCTGESLFIRAYCHFNLVNIFGDVPLITTTDVTVTAKEPRTPTAQVNGQVIADLIQAIPLLSVNYPTTEKIRPSRWAAQALLAKVYLYQQNWQQAEAQATAVIGSGLYPLSPIATVFYKNSNEAIWQLWNTNGYTGLSVPTVGVIPALTISPQLLASFESGDLRKTNWTTPIVAAGTTYTAPFKYKLKAVTTGASAEYTMYLRSAEQYLIRAEARAQQNTNLTGAINDLNIIRTRAGLPNLNPSSNQAQILAAVSQERRVELFDEAGHRFFDLNRTNQINTIMSVIKPTWSIVRSPLFPIPQTQILINGSLTQNAGY